jgi:hypothetical protein
VTRLWKHSTETNLPKFLSIENSVCSSPVIRICKILLKHSFVCLAFENGVLAFENGVQVLKKGILAFEN